MVRKPLVQSMSVPKQSKVIQRSCAMGALSLVELPEPGACGVDYHPGEAAVLARPPILFDRDSGRIREIDDARARHYVVAALLWRARGDARARLPSGDLSGRGRARS